MKSIPSINLHVGKMLCGNLDLKGETVHKCFKPELPATQ